MISCSSTPKRATPGKFATNAMGIYPWRQRQKGSLAKNNGNNRFTSMGSRLHSKKGAPGRRHSPGLPPGIVHRARSRTRLPDLQHWDNSQYEATAIGPRTSLASLTSSTWFHYQIFARPVTVGGHPWMVQNRMIGQERICHRRGLWRLPLANKATNLRIKHAPDLKTKTNEIIFTSSSM